MLKIYTNWYMCVPFFVFLSQLSIIYYLFELAICNRALTVLGMRERRRRREKRGRDGGKVAFARNK